MVSRTVLLPPPSGRRSCVCDGYSHAVCQQEGRAHQVHELLVHDPAVQIIERFRLHQQRAIFRRCRSTAGGCEHEDEQDGTGSREHVREFRQRQASPLTMVCASTATEIMVSGSVWFLGVRGVRVIRIVLTVPQGVRFVDDVPGKSRVGVDIVPD